MAIALLGPLTVDGEKPLEPRDRVALSLLAVHVGAVVSPDRFAEAIWGGDPPPSWPKQVQICIGRLRKVLGAVAIQTVPGGYRLALSEESVDSCRFERLLERARTLAASGESDRAAVTFARALALWRGPPLADLDRWAPARIEVARLAELRLSAEEDLLQARLAAGEHREVAAEAQALPRARRAGTRPARAREDLPQPDGPARTSTGAVARRARQAATSAVRPKKLSLSSTSYGTRPR